MKYIAYLLVGSNVDKETCYPAAFLKIASLGEVLAVSPVYETEPVRMIGAPDFFNGALKLRTELDPETFKSRLITDVEEPLGRRRQGTGPIRPRTIDVDIALWDDLVGTIAGRQVPDPDLLTCIHAARPMADIAPDLRHPVTGQTMAAIAEQLTSTCALPRIRPDVILPL
nr:2-amino-4-hydroxy-6-hydroxymethyldihydropteridine diphosphokinase [Candidatus Krumholzibacteria bacterium]